MTKVAIITGSSSGIGEGLAYQYAKKGYHLGLLARRTESLIVIKDKINAMSDVEVAVLTCDVSDKVAVFAAIESVIDRWGKVDLLIANAGVSVASPAYEAPVNCFETTFNINVMGAGYSAYAVIPHMVKQKRGKIVVISSLAGYRGLPEAGVYCASKAAVNALFESMRLDLKKYGVTVSIIRPGYIKTALTDRNNYYMPFLQPLATAIVKIVNAIEQKKAIYSFPWPLAFVVKSFYFWPRFLYDWCFAGRRNDKRVD